MKVNFESEIEVETKYGSQYKPIYVVANVTAEPDAYATGDSPTLYDVEIDSVTLDDEEVVNKLDPIIIEHLMNEVFTKDIL